MKIKDVQVGLFGPYGRPSSFSDVLRYVAVDVVHSSEIRGLCSMKYSSKTLQKGNRTFARPNLRED